MINIIVALVALLLFIAFSAFIWITNDYRTVLVLLVLYYLDTIGIRIDNAIGLIFRLPLTLDLHMLRVHVRRHVLRVAVQGDRGVLLALYRLAANLVSIKLLWVELRLRSNLLLIANEPWHDAGLLRLMTQVPELLIRFF